MNEHMSTQEYKEIKKNHRKYGERKTVHDGITYDSKLEAKHAAEYQFMAKEKVIVAYIPQVSIPLALPKDGNPGTRMRIDHMLVKKINADGSFVAEFVDSKGMVTPEWKIKAAMLKAIYGITVRVRKK